MARERYEEEAAAFYSAEESEKEHRRELAASAVSFLEGRLKGSTASMPEELRAIAYLREHDVLSRRIAEEQRAIAQFEVNRLTEELASLSQQPAAAPARKAEASVPLLATFEGYADEQQIKPTTRTEWRAVIRRLIAFLGHDDAARVTADDLDRWREALATEPTNRGQLRSPRTIRDAYMAAVSATLRWAVEKRRLPENVASKVRVRVPKKAKLRERDFTPDEAQAILSATLALPPARMSAELAFARRWIPWLCAYTGARVNEISQLRKEDVLELDGIAAIRITPEAGTVKANAARVVPLDPHLIEQGFLAAAAAKADGPLFYDEARGRGGIRRAKKVGERLAAWVREGVGIIDPGLQPNHGWRHTFKTRATAAGIPERVADAIQGHAATNVSRGYCSTPLATMAEAIARVPRFEAGRWRPAADNELELRRCG